MSDLSNVIRCNTISHFNSVCEQPKCEPACRVQDLMEAAILSACMDEKSRIHAVCFMPLSMTAPPEDQNELTASDPMRALKQKRRLVEEALAISRGETVYCNKGQSFCRSTFFIVVQISVSPLKRHAKAITAADTFFVTITPLASFFYTLFAVYRRKKLSNEL